MHGCRCLIIRPLQQAMQRMHCGCMTSSLRRPPSFWATALRSSLLVRHHLKPHTLRSSQSPAISCCQVHSCKLERGHKHCHSQNGCQPQQSYRCIFPSCCVSYLDASISRHGNPGKVTASSVMLSSHHTPICPTESTAPASIDTPPEVHPARTIRQAACSACN